MTYFLGNTAPQILVPGRNNALASNPSSPDAFEDKRAGNPYRSSRVVSHSRYLLKKTCITAFILTPNVRLKSNPGALHLGITCLFMK